MYPSYKLKREKTIQTLSIQKSDIHPGLWCKPPKKSFTCNRAEQYYKFKFSGSNSA